MKKVDIVNNISDRDDFIVGQETIVYDGEDTNNNLIAIVSDLHLDDIPLHEMKERIIEINKIKADYLILAGDICSNLVSNDIYDIMRPDVKKIILVRGNHEYYGNYVGYSNEYPDHIHCLTIDNPLEVDGMRFTGDTLWTNIPEDASDYIGSRINDYKAIHKDSSENDLITTDFTSDIHLEHIEGIRKSLSTDSNIKNIVVTHHSPSHESIVPRFLGSNINHAFHSNAIDNFIDSDISLWIHGHCHDNIEYDYNGIKVICNPYGYYGERVNNSIRYLYI